MWNQGGQQQGGQRKESNHFGGYGGGGVDFTQNPNLSLVGARGKYGELIDNIQFLFVDITTHQYV